jgi:hypothetical protein
MPTFTITDSDVGSGDFDLDLRDAGEAAGVGSDLENDDPIVLTIAAQSGLTDITEMLIKGIGDDSSGDTDIITFDLSTFEDSFDLVVSPGGGKPGADDILIFDGASSVVDEGGGFWTVTYSTGGTEYTLNVDAGVAQVQGINPPPDGVVDGEDTGEVMGTGYDDSNAPNDGGGDIIDGADGDDDSILGNGGNDTIDAGAGNDTVAGGTGDDDISGGAGNDSIFGDEAVPPSREIFSWAAESDFADNNPISDFTQVTGSATITFDVVSGSPGSVHRYETDNQNTDNLDAGINANSSLESVLDDENDSATYSWSSDTPLENVEFRINDIDNDAVIRIVAYDESNNAIEVQLTNLGSNLSGTDTDAVSGIDQVESIDPGSSFNNSDAEGSFLVTIPGPVSSWEVIHEQDGSNDSIITISDIAYDVPAPSGNDSIEGGAGNDTIFGDADDASAGRVSFNWSDIPDPDDGGVIDDNDEITTGTQTVGNVEVDFNFSSVSGTFTNNTQYVTGIDADGATVDNQSALSFDATGSAELSFSTAVNNVEFRINDFEDQLEDLQITVYDENDQPTTYTVTLGSEVSGTDTDAVAGLDTFEGTSGSTNNDSSAEGSILVEIPGPASRIEFDFTTTGGTLTLTDIWFDDPTVVTSAGDDTIDGGDGSDLLYGNGGDDVIYVDQGDTATGGDGDDTFILQDLDTTGSGNAAIDIVGGEGEETGGDTLVLTSDVAYDDINFTNTNDASGGLSGNFTMSDGTVVTFSEIENIICFTQGTMILTAQGERPVEQLERGDRVLTRDHGLQPVRWIGRRTVSGKGRFAPVRFAQHVLPGLRSDLLVSPQHRVILEGYHAELLFGDSEVFAAAKHMVNDKDVVQEEIDTVTYFHIMFDEHEVIYSNGAPTESFHAGDVGLHSITEAAREELFALFPDLRHWSGGHGPAARTSLKRYEAELLSQQMRA